MRSFLLAVVVTLACLGNAIAEGVADLVSASVLVSSTRGSGSGVIVKNGPHVFVWTAAHVVNEDQRVSVVVDTKTGQPRADITYRDVTVSQPVFCNGRKVGDNVRLAKIIRFSDGTRGGEDLALLQLYDSTFGTSAVAFDNAGPPKVGTALWHVGSQRGAVGSNSVSEGIFSAPGRLASDEQESKVYDQVSIPALAGCSGGGVFLKSNGCCIGLLVRGIGRGTEAANLIVPARRVRDYARRTHCLWAIDAKVSVPENDDEVVGDRPLALDDVRLEGLSPAKPANPGLIPIILKP